MRHFAVITSKENPQVKLCVRLQNSSRFRRENGLFMIEGLRNSMDAVLNGYKLDTVFYTKEIYAKYQKDISMLIENSVNVYQINNEVLIKIADTSSPQGVICICKLPTNYGMSHIDNNGRYVYLDNVQDPSNIGAISRTAEALGISGLIISGGCDPYSPKAIRAGMGSLLRIPLIFPENTDTLLNFIKDLDMILYATVPNNTAEKLNNVNFSKAAVVLIGNEANGLDPELISQCNHIITIPMTGRAESLNAAAAAAIIMWEMVK